MNWMLEYMSVFSVVAVVVILLNLFSLKTDVKIVILIHLMSCIVTSSERSLNKEPAIHFVIFIGGCSLLGWAITRENNRYISMTTKQSPSAEKFVQTWGKEFKQKAQKLQLSILIVFNDSCLEFMENRVRKTFYNKDSCVAVVPMYSL